MTLTATDIDTVVGAQHATTIVEAQRPANAHFAAAKATPNDADEVTRLLACLHWAHALSCA